MELASKSWKQLKKRSNQGVLDDQRNLRLLRKVASVDLCFASSTKDDVIDTRRQFKTDLSNELVSESINPSSTNLDVAGLTNVEPNHSKHGWKKLFPASHPWTNKSETTRHGGTCQSSSTRSPCIGFQHELKRGGSLDESLVLSVSRLESCKPQKKASSRMGRLGVADIVIMAMRARQKELTAASVAESANIVPASGGDGMVPLGKARRMSSVLTDLSRHKPVLHVTSSGHLPMIARYSFVHPYGHQPTILNKETDQTPKDSTIILVPNIDRVSNSMAALWTVFLLIILFVTVSLILAAASDQHRLLNSTIHQNMTSLFWSS